MNGRACERCEWWGSSAGRTGQCRAGPPTAVQSDPAWFGVWPKTRPDDWCGQYRAREADAGGYDRRAKA